LSTKDARKTAHKTRAIRPAKFMFAAAEKALEKFHDR